MKIKLFIFICLLGLMTQAVGQIIDNREGNAFQDEMFFSQEFLWQNKISSITGVSSIKRVGRAIESKPDIVVYKFNETGQLLKIDAVRSVLSIVDSTSIQFDRNELGVVERRNELGRNGFSSTQFVYDSKGRIIRTDNSVSENTSNEKLKLVPGLTVTLNSENFNYSEPSTHLLRKVSYNNYGLPYSTELIYRDSAGYLLKIEQELSMSGKSFTTYYNYNEKGWVDEISTIDASTGEKSKRENFNYDKVGNLTKISYYNKEKLVREIEIIYGATSLIEATLDQDMSTKDILITKFTYEFRK